MVIIAVLLTIGVITYLAKVCFFAYVFLRKDFDLDIHIPDDDIQTNPAGKRKENRSTH